jgi:GntR family phosphonate transport system transcriptional regulator
MEDPVVGIATMELDRTGRVPLYVQIAEELEGALRRGYYRPGDRLPTEQALAKQYGVNRHTAGQALSHLQDRGFIYRVRSRGSFVRPGRITYPVLEKGSFTASISSVGLKPSHEILNVRRVRAYGRVAAEMRIPTGELLVAFERISYAGEFPLIYGTKHFRDRLFPGLRDLLGECPSLRVLIKSHYGLELYGATSVIELELADPELSRYLGVPVGASLLKVEGLSVLDDGTPAQWDSSYVRGDAIRISRKNREPKEVRD